MTLFQRIRKKGKNRKGFTLGELLIVVAIIGVLVAISIPIFTKQVRKAQIATFVANTRSYYSVLLTEFIECYTYGYSLDPFYPIKYEGDNYYWYFKDHNGNEQKFPLPGFLKLKGKYLNFSYGETNLEGEFYTPGHTNHDLFTLRKNGKEYYPYFYITTEDGETYSFGTLPEEYYNKTPQTQEKVVDYGEE